MQRAPGILLSSLGLLTLIVVLLIAPDSAGYLAAIAIPLFCIAITGLDPVRLTCACLALSVVAHWLKRAMFLFGDQPAGAYYAVTATPVFLACILVATMWPKRRLRTPASAFLLGVFVVLGLTNTLIKSREFAAAAGMFQYLAPIVFYFVGLALPDKALEPLGRTAVRIGAVSLLYALVQFTTGPTAIDAAWAEGATFSSQAAKVLVNIHQGFDSDLFRPYGLHSDPFAWGMSLIAMVALVGMSQGRRRSGRNWLIASVVIASAGLLLCLDRSPIMGFLASLAFCFSAGKGWFRKPATVIAALGLSMVIVVSVGQYLIGNFGDLDKLRDQSLVSSRYLEVGTLSARTSAETQFVDALQRYPFFGEGMGASAAGTSRDSSAGAADELAYSHNVAVDLIFVTGGLGALCFLGFIYQFLAEVLRMRRRVADPKAVRVACWVFGAAVGFLLTGFASGAAFLDSDFFLILGIGAGWAARRMPSREGRRVPLNQDTPEIRTLVESQA